MIKRLMYAIGWVDAEEFAVALNHIESLETKVQELEKQSKKPIQDNNRLLRCPFCGSKAQISPPNEDIFQFGWSVWCTNEDECGAELTVKSKQDMDAAIAAWNKRGSPESTLDLLPCPFCGETEHLSLRHNPADSNYSHNSWFVECEKCDYIGSDRETRSDCVNWWNTRA